MEAFCDHFVCKGTHIHKKGESFFTLFLSLSAEQFSEIIFLLFLMLLLCVANILSLMSGFFSSPLLVLYTQFHFLSSSHQNAFLLCKCGDAGIAEVCSAVYYYIANTYNFALHLDFFTSFLLLLLCLVACGY